MNDYEIEAPPGGASHAVGPMKAGPWLETTASAADAQAALMSALSRWQVLEARPGAVRATRASMTLGTWNGITAEFRTETRGEMTIVSSEAGLNKGVMGKLQLWDGANDRGRLCHGVLRAAASQSGGVVRGYRRGRMALLLAIVVAVEVALFAIIGAF